MRERAGQRPFPRNRKGPWSHSKGTSGSTAGGPSQRIAPGQPTADASGTAFGLGAERGQHEEGDPGDESGSPTRSHWTATWSTAAPVVGLGIGTSWTVRGRRCASRHSGLSTHAGAGLWLRRRRSATSRARLPPPLSGTADVPGGEEAASWQCRLGRPHRKFGRIAAKASRGTTITPAPLATSACLPFQSSRRSRSPAARRVLCRAR